jgi:hypothetical protein
MTPKKITKKLRKGKKLAATRTLTPIDVYIQTGNPSGEPPTGN